MDARVRRGRQLRFDKVRRSFDGKTAIDIDALDIDSGSITVLLGRSGCGKSTLLSLAGGLLVPDTGRVLHDGLPLTAPPRAFWKGVDGTDIADIADTAIVFQHNNLFPWMSAADNLVLALRNRGATKARARTLARQWLDEVGLRDYADYKPAQLSGGMRQRVALARTLATSPRLLMLDEPFSALDVQTRRLMQACLLKVWEQTGATVLMVTHDLDEALALADRIVLMGAQPAGHIAQVIDLPQPRPRERNNPALTEIATTLNAFLEAEARQAEHF